MARYESKTRRRDWVKIRLRFIGLMMLVCLAGLWGRAYQIQILRGPELARQADRQYWAAEKLQGKRGEILDRNGRLLAKTVSVQSVYARPLEIESQAGAARVVATALDMPVKDVRGLLSQRKPFVWIARKVGDKAAARIREAQVPGVYLTAESRRFYPRGHLAGQLLGFVGMDGEGLEGLERSFDSRLSGKKARNVVLRDAAGHRLFASGQDASGIAGQDLQLTIDANLQFAAEEILAQAVRQYKGRWGVCLLVEVHSGDILSWAQYPFFDPNTFASATPALWRNRVLLDAVEPGSTLKPLLVAAALEEGICDRDSEYNCEEGKWRHKGVTFNDTHEYGTLPVHQVVRYSSNIGAAKIGLGLGAQSFYRYLKAFGFEESTHLPVSGENRGLVRPPHAWTEIDLAATSFGQSLSMNAAQLARAYLCLANKGVLKPLRLVMDPQPDLPRERRVVSASTAEDVLHMLRDVVEEDGTGTQARIVGIQVGGKTGTAQKASAQGGYADKYLATFVGLIPALDPDYLILVMVDEPTTNHYGGVVAAPAVREIAVKTLAYHGGLPAQSGVLADREEPGTGRVNQVVARAALQRQAGSSQGQRGEIPDLTGLSLRRALDLLAPRGILPRLEGEGVIVVRQESPADAAESSQAGIWTLWLGFPEGRTT